MHKTGTSILLAGLLTIMSQSVAARGGHYYGHHGGHHHGGDEGAALVAGLIIGGLFGYMISEDRHRYSQPYPDYRHSRYYEPDYYRRDYYPRDYARSYDYPRSRVIYRQPAPTARVSMSGSSEFGGQACLMTREYTTTVRIDGIEREAYGTRCMTADGGWIFGRPKVMPD